MGPYAFMNILLMERTDLVVAPNGVMTQIIPPPIINSNQQEIKPVGFAIVASTGDFILTIGNSGNLGDQRDVDSANLSASEQLVFPIHKTTEIWMEGAIGDEDVTVRWFWPNKARQGSGLGVFSQVSLPPMTAQIDAPAVEAVIPLPTKAAELIIQSIDQNAIAYRIDDGVDNGEPVVVDSSDVSPSTPYIIHINDSDRFRLEQNGGASTIFGYWRLS
jgi:hypothetical protein